MSFKEIAFIANWASNNKDVVDLIATNTKWSSGGIKVMIESLEIAANKKISEEINKYQKDSNLKHIKHR